MKERPILFSGPMVRAILEGRKTQTRRIFKDKVSADCVGFRADDNGEWRQRFDLGGKVHSKAWTHKCPYGVVGDRLWVKETWIDTGSIAHYGGGEEAKYEQCVTYVADGAERTIMVTEEQSKERLSKAVARQRKHCPPKPTDTEASDYFERLDAYHKWITKQYKMHRPSIFMPRWASRITLEVVSVKVERLQEISEGDAQAEGVEADDEPCDHTRRSCEEVGCLGQTFKSTFCTLWAYINGTDSWRSNPWVWVIEFKPVEGRAA